MPGRPVRAAVAALAVLAALSSACTTSEPPSADAQQQPSGPASAAPTAASPSATRSTTVARAPTGIDYVQMKRRLAKEITDGAGSLQEVRAVLVSVDGRTELEYYQDRGPDERAHVWSVTKSVLSILVGMAVDDGRLQLDQTLAELLPEHLSVMTPEQQAITLRQLLTMTAGVAADDGGLSLEAEDPVELFLTYGMSADRGTTFIYSDGGAHLVATILRRALDRSILDYARDRLFDPLDIETQPAWEGSEQYEKNGFDDAGFAWMVDTTGVHSGGFGLKLTARDLVKIGQLYLDGGRWQGRQLVSESWVRESTSNQLTADQGQGDQYGYLWWVIDEPETPGFMAAGLFYQRIIVVPTRRLVIVTTANDTGYADSAIAADFDPILSETVIEPLLE